MAILLSMPHPPREMPVMDGPAVRRIRNARGLSLRTLAGSVGLDISTLSKCEREILPLPAMTTRVEKFAAALNIAPDEIVIPQRPYGGDR